MEAWARNASLQLESVGLFIDQSLMSSRIENRTFIVTNQRPIDYVSINLFWLEQ